jgi:membrane-bound metal-dependent hydrolase YbcI (DUF457 family)
MSVTAHLTEMYFARYKAPRLNFRWLLLGCYFPDGMGASKLLLLVTGNNAYHRDIVFGWTHSFPVCGLFAAVIGAVFGKRAGWSFLFAAWLHVVMDLGDPIGEKLFFPFSEEKYALSLWPWKDGDILADMAVYYSAPVSLGVEALCLLLALYACRRLTGTMNPVRATLALWHRDGWFDRPREPRGRQEGVLVDQPSPGISFEH